MVVKHLRPVLSGVSGMPPTDREKIESAFLRRLHSELGGPQTAEDAYRTWAAKSHVKSPEISDLMKIVAWESAHIKATNAALEGCGCDTSAAFFILHLGG